MTDPMMHRRGDVARAVAGALDQQWVVVCGLGSSSRAWRDLGADRPTYYASDPMGLALPLAAGIALARADLEVALLVGDGDLMMGLNSLVTVAAAAVTNLHVVVLVNGRYETGGGRPLAGDPERVFVDLARAAGFPAVTSAGEDLTADVERVLGQVGPTLLAVRVEVEAAPYGGPGRWSGAEERMHFERALASRDDGTTREER